LGERPKLIVLDSLRGIAAISVVLLHVPVAWPLYDSNFVTKSFLLVDFFFILSGFVIALNYQEKIDSWGEAKEFIVARFLRLYPLHLFIMCLFCSLQLLRVIFEGADGVGSSERYSIYNFVVSLFLMNSFGFATGSSWNYPSWSISAEVATYLVFCFSTLTLKFGYWLVWGVLISISLVLIDYFNLHESTTNFGILRGVAGFGCGIFLYKIYDKSNYHVRRFAKGKPLIFASLEIVVCLMFSSLFFEGSGEMVWWSIYPIFCCAIYVFSFESWKISGLLSNSILSYIGKISYSIYMVHALILSSFFGLLRVVDKNEEYFTWVPLAPEEVTRHDHVLILREVPGTLMLIVLLIVILVSSHFTFYMVENRFKSQRSKEISKPNQVYNRIPR